MKYTLKFYKLWTKDSSKCIDAKLSPLLLLPLLPHLSPLSVPGLSSRTMSTYSVGYLREIKEYTQATT